MLTARDITDTTAFFDPTPTISYNPYSYSIPDYYSYSFPTYSYSIPSITVPSYSIPSFDVPTYSWTAPSITVPDVSYPTAGGSGGKSTDVLPGTVTTAMKKINWKKIIGAIVGSVTGFFGLLGGLWAACKRKMRRAGRGGNDEEKYAGTLYGRVPSEMGGVGALPYQQNSGHGRFGSTVHEPLLAGNYYPQVSSVMIALMDRLTYDFFCSTTPDSNLGSTCRPHFELYVVIDTIAHVLSFIILYKSTHTNLVFSIKFLAGMFLWERSVAGWVAG